MKQEREATIVSTGSNKEVRRTMKTREEVAHIDSASAFRSRPMIPT